MIAVLHDTMFIKMNVWVFLLGEFLKWWIIFVIGYHLGASQKNKKSQPCRYIRSGCISWLGDDSPADDPNSTERRLPVLALKGVSPLTASK